MQRAARHLWQRLGEAGGPFEVKASFLEVYNERVNDLLDRQRCNLNLHWDSSYGFFAEDLLLVDCGSAAELLEVFAEGLRNRKRGAHALNAHSSRSHAVLSVHVLRPAGPDRPGCYGKVCFVDLAGSERLKESGATGAMAREAQQINKSLSTLGKIIAGLARRQPGHLPYRDSKLTMLLMDALGGRAKTLMIACLSPAEGCAEETMLTLSYAAAAALIKNAPSATAFTATPSLAELMQANEALRSENEYLRNQRTALPPLTPSQPALCELEAKYQNLLGAHEELHAKVKKLENFCGKTREEIQISGAEEGFGQGWSAEVLPPPPPREDVAALHARIKALEERERDLMQLLNRRAANSPR